MVRGWCCYGLSNATVLECSQLWFCIFEQVNGLFAGHTPLQVACLNGQMDVAECLIKHDADLEIEVSCLVAHTVVIFRHWHHKFVFYTLRIKKEIALSTMYHLLMKQGY